MFNAGAHGLGGLDDAAVHFSQGSFHQPCKERRTASHQRWDCSGHAQGRADQHYGEGDHNDQQDDEWHRTEHVHHERQHRIGHRLFQQLAFAEQEQKNADG